MGASNEKALYEAIHDYDVDVVRHLIYSTGVDPNTNVKPYLSGKNLPDVVLPLKECLNKINSPPVSNAPSVPGGRLLAKTYSPEQRREMRSKGGVILKILLEKGATVDKDDVLLVLEGYRNLNEKLPLWAGKSADTEDPSAEHLRLLMEGKGGLEAVNEVKELFRVWETEVYEKTRGDHRWQLDVKFKQKEVLDGLKQSDLIVTVSDESVHESSSTGSSSAHDHIYEL